VVLARTSLLGQISGASGNYGTSTFTSTAFTPPADSLLVACVSAIENGGSDSLLPDLTIAGGDLAYSLRASAGVSAGFTAATAIYTAPVFLNEEMTIVLDCGARSIGIYSISVLAYTGHDLTDPIGETATGQQSGGFTGPPTPISLTLSSTPAGTSEIVAAAGVCKSPSAGVTPGSGWDELHEVHNTDWGGLQTQVKTNPDSTTVPWADLRSGGGAVFNYAAAAVEVLISSDTVIAIGAGPPLMSSSSAFRSSSSSGGFRAVSSSGGAR